MSIKGEIGYISSMNEDVKIEKDDVKIEPEFQCEQFYEELPMAPLKKEDCKHKMKDIS